MEHISEQESSGDELDRWRVREDICLLIPDKPEAAEAGQQPSNSYPANPRRLFLSQTASTIYTAHRLNLQYNPTADRQPGAFPESTL